MQVYFPDFLALAARALARGSAFLAELFAIGFLGVSFLESAFLLLNFSSNSLGILRDLGIAAINI